MASFEKTRRKLQEKKKTKLKVKATSPKRKGPAKQRSASERSAAQAENERGRKLNAEREDRWSLAQYYGTFKLREKRAPERPSSEPFPTMEASEERTSLSPEEGELLKALNAARMKSRGIRDLKQIQRKDDILTTLSTLRKKTIPCGSSLSDSTAASKRARTTSES